MPQIVWLDGSQKPEPVYAIALRQYPDSFDLQTFRPGNSAIALDNIVKVTRDGRVLLCDSALGAMREIGNIETANGYFRIKPWLRDLLEKYAASV